MNESHDLPPGVTVLERGWLSANNILFVDEQQAALVDSGYCSHAEQTVALVARELGARPLGLLLNTHLHSDHCGGNAALQAHHPQLRTLVPPGQARHVRDWDPVALTYEPTGQSCPRFHIEGTLDPGARVVLGGREWQVHAAPGHDPHSIIFFEPQSKVLLSADALWQNGFGVVFPELEGESAFDEVAATLQLIEELAPAVVVPGHGEVFYDVHAALASARRRLAGYRADPRRHALHAAKVLLKFKLLELQRMSFSELERWALATPYFRLLFARYFDDGTPAAWLQSLVASLVSAGAAEVAGAEIINV